MPELAPVTMAIPARIAEEVEVAAISRILAFGSLPKRLTPGDDHHSLLLEGTRSKQHQDLVVRYHFGLPAAGMAKRVLWVWLLCAPAAASAFCVPSVAFAGVPTLVGRRTEGARLGRLPLFAKRKAPARVQPHIDVNNKFPGLKQVNKDPAIFTIDNFFDDETCDRYLELGPAGEASGQSLKVDSGVCR